MKEHEDRRLGICGLGAGPVQLDEVAVRQFEHLHFACQWRARQEARQQRLHVGIVQPAWW